MPIITKSYYTDIYRGREIDDELFLTLSARAEEVIGGITFGRAAAAAETADAATLKSLKFAVCAETEYLNELGDGSYTGSSDGEVSREEAGNASISYRNREVLRYNGVPVSGLALMLLGETELLYKGI